MDKFTTQLKKNMKKKTFPDGSVFLGEIRQ